MLIPHFEVVMQLTNFVEHSYSYESNSFSTI